MTTTWNRLLWGTPKQPPDIDAQTKKIAIRISEVQARLLPINAELNQINAQMTQTKSAGTLATLRTRAALLMNDKRSLESQIAQLQGQSSNFRQIQHSTESLENTIMAAEVLKESAAQLKFKTKQLSVADVSGTLDEMRDCLDDATEIQKLMNRNFTVSSVYTDEQLDADMAALAEEMQYQQTVPVGSFPVVPVQTIEVSGNVTPTAATATAAAAAAVAIVTQQTAQQ